MHFSAIDSEAQRESECFLCNLSVQKLWDFKREVNYAWTFITMRL